MARQWALLCLLLSVCSPFAHALEPGQLSVSLQYESTRDFSGVAGLAVQRTETELNLPYLLKSTYAGDWAFAFNLKENRLGLSGPLTMGRRFYRFAFPIRYYPRPKGRLSYIWHIEPSHYSDESIVGQTRQVFEYGFVAKYKANRKASWVAGIKKDNRFGGTSWYPVFGLEAKPNRRMHHHWVFPDIYSKIQLKKRVSITAYMQPNGSQWDYDQGDGSTATFVLADRNAGLALRLKTRMPYELVLQAGMSFMGEGSVAAQEGDLTNAYYLKLGLETPLP